MGVRGVYDTPSDFATHPCFYPCHGFPDGVLPGEVHGEYGVGTDIGGSKEVRCGLERCDGRHEKGVKTRGRKVGRGDL